MHVQTYATVADVSGPETLRGRAAAVIDVLRATSVICTALDAGAVSVRPVLTPEEALAAVGRTDTGTVLGGERGGLRIPGFDLGNSPLEYIGERVAGRELVITTTNGTRALHRAAPADAVAALSLLNVSAVARWLSLQKRDVAVICAGTHDQFSIDDALCAGAVAERVIANGPVEICDMTLACLELYRGARGRIREMLRSCVHGRRLLALGFGDDLDYCAREDRFNVVPVLTGDVLRVLPERSGSS